MPQQDTNGSDFVAAFSRGLQDRMESEKTKQQLEEQKQLLPWRKEQLKAQIKAHEAEIEHAKTLIDQAKAARVSQIMAEFHSGLRNIQTSPTVGIGQTQSMSPGNDSSPSLPLTPGAASGLNLSPDAYTNSTQTVDDPLLGKNAQIQGVVSPTDATKQQLLQMNMMLPGLQAAEEAKQVSLRKTKQIEFAEKTAGELQVEGVKGKNSKEVQQMKDESALNVANVNKSAIALEGEQNRLKDLKVAGIHADAQIAAANIHAKVLGNVDPTTLRGYSDAVLSGALQFATLPKDAKNAVAKEWGEKGFIPPEKSALSVVRSLPLINDILHQALNMAKNNSGVVAYGSTVTGFGDSANKLRALTGLGGQLAELFSKEVGRKNDNDIKRAVNLLYSPKATTQENIQNVDRAAKILVNIVRPHIAAYSPEQLQQMLKLQGIDSGSILDPALVQELKAVSGGK